MVINPFPMNPVLAAPDSLLGGADRMGVNGFHIGLYPTHQKLEIMRRFRPHFMVISPTYLTRIDQAKRDLISKMGVGLKDKTGVKMTLEESSTELPKFEFKAVRWTDERLKGRQRIAWHAQG